MHLIFRHKISDKIIYILIPFLILLSLLFGRYSDIINLSYCNWHLYVNAIVTGLPCFALGLFINTYKKNLIQYLLHISAFVIGVILIEFSILYYTNTIDTSLGMYISTIPLAVLCVLYCLKYPNITFINTIGKVHSTNIYIYHMISLSILLSIGIDFSFKPLMVFVVSLLISYVIITLQRFLKSHINA